MVNHCYCYCLDRDFGPFFLKFCSYFPDDAKLCLNGHEYAKCQTRKEGIGCKALAATICDQLGPEQIDALLRRWLAKPPHPFAPQDREAGYRYDLSIPRAEFSLTQILDRPLSGRVLLDLGRPDMVQLIFDRRVTKRTPGRFRTQDPSIPGHGIRLQCRVILHRTHARLYRPGFAEILPNAPPGDSQMQRRLSKIEAESDRRVNAAKLAA